jgi:transcription elongation factor GreB
MSKAFTRESDDARDERPLARPFSIPGGKNYLTPAGAQRLREEMEQLLRNAPSSGNASNDVRRENPASQQRIQYLQQSLAAAVIVPSPPQPWEQVLFGATVELRNAKGEKSRYRIVGMDETDLDRNWISWLSPISRALLKARLGQRVEFRMPDGNQEWEIIGIRYE